MTTIADAHVREQALDVTQSFIIQAPAGSGKTELLIQRYLKLLTTVDAQPEEVLAITFTRKAAAEMQHRVLQALAAAQQPEPQAPHAQKTWQLARAVLARDQALNWQLQANPQRLCITTIDSFCAHLAQQLPMLAQIGQLPEVTTEPGVLYQLAVQQFLQELDTPSAPAVAEALGIVLGHLDNRFSVCAALLESMLARREQWLEVVLASGQQTDLLAQLASHLQQIFADDLVRFQQLIDPSDWQQLHELLLYAQAHYDQPLPLDLAETDPNCWVNLANWLLTQSGQWRKQVNKHQGFPAKADHMTTEERQQAVQMKADMKAWLADCPTRRAAWLPMLQRFQYFPVEGYSEQQAQVLSALLVCLPVCVAHLRVVFAAEGQVDFNEIGIAALQALGSLTHPSELALALDYRIRHILVDEFQDTSDLQYRLLYALTRGWSAEEGRTLFLVGDPMQSIYRFRQADVGLFLQTIQQGLGDVSVQYLQLQVNFRSAAPLVDWFNHTFSQVFPPYADVLNGAVDYATAVAARTDNGHVHWHISTMEDQQAAAEIVACVAQLQQQAPQASVAILVRSRRHLTDILPLLAEQGVPVSAVELLNLTQFACIQDLQALTLAMTDYADRLAWLAICRAPWCGLALADLHLLAEASRVQTVWSAMPQVLPHLSSDGQQRLQHVQQVLQPLIQQQGRMPLHQMIQQAWQALGGPLCMTNHAQMQPIVAQFFTILQRYQHDAVLSDRQAFQTQLACERVTLSAAAANSVQVMTIHKSKGLEFDHVILPGLHKGTRAEDAPLLLWQEYPQKHGVPQLLLAPLKAYAEQQDPVYQFLYAMQRDKAQFEAQRLLYVAATRARQGLHLFAQVNVGKTGALSPRAGSFLNLLWPVMQASHVLDDLNTISASDIEDLNEVTPPPTANIQRLPLTALPVAMAKSMPDAVTAPAHVGAMDAQAFARIQGMVMHAALAQLGRQAAVDIDDSRHLPHWQILCRQHGLVGDNLTKCLYQLEQALHNMQQDPQAHWLLQAHPQHWVEYALSYSCADSGQLKQVIIDRCFIDAAGTLWIVDYKTAVPNEAEEVADFLLRMAGLHQAQLLRYRQVLSMRYPERSIRCGLYFPMQALWHEVSVTDVLVGT